MSKQDVQYLNCFKINLLHCYWWVVFII